MTSKSPQSRGGQLLELLRRLFARDLVCCICGATVDRRESHIVTPLSKGRCCANCYATAVLINQEMEQRARDQRRIVDGDAS